MTEVILEKVVKRYGAVEVVHGVDLEVKSGELVVLVGPSGCGKSTTLRMIAGLEDISGGVVSIGDRVVNRIPPRTAMWRWCSRTTRFTRIFRSKRTWGSACVCVGSARRSGANWCWKRPKFWA